MREERYEISLRRIVFSFELIFHQLFIPYLFFKFKIQLQIGKNENIHAWKLNLINYLLINKISNLIFENKILNEKMNDKII